MMAVPIVESRASSRASLHFCSSISWSICHEANHLIHPIVLLVLVGILYGCGSDISGPDNKNGTDTLANDTLSGYVQLYDETGLEIFDRSGVTVRLEGTPYTATSATDGRWMITSLPPGTYTLAYSKEGFGTFKQFGFSFVGNGEGFASRVNLSRIPSFAPLWLSASTADPIGLSGTIPSTSPYQRRVLFFLGTDSTVSSENYRMVLTTQVQPGTGSFGLGVHAKTLKQEMSVQSGQKVYVVAHGSSSNMTTYYDARRNVIIHTPISEPSIVISFIIP